MKFGTSSTDELSNLNLSLPKEKPGNEHFFISDRKGRFFIGCAKWGRDEWVGEIYPEGTKEKEFLKNYIGHFNAIELNSTFYNAKKANVLKWAGEGDDDFKFCPKFPRLISHIKRLKGIEDFAAYFADTCMIFGDNLGMPFLQLPENFGPANQERLETFFRFFPKDFRLALELRHKDWFNDQEFEEVCALLEKFGHSFIITDTAMRRDVIHMKLTSPVAFIRFNGYLEHQTDFTRMDEWADTLVNWIDNGIDVYFFAHQPDEALTPKTISYMAKKMEEKGIPVSKRPRFIN